MVNVIETKKTRFQMGYNDKLFDWTYVGNVSDAHLLAADHLSRNTDGVAGEVFFITNGQPILGLWTRDLAWARTRQRPKARGPI